MPKGIFRLTEGPADAQIRAAHTVFTEHGETNAGLFHPDLEWHNDPESPGAGVDHGLDAVRRDLAVSVEGARDRALAAAGL